MDEVVNLLVTSYGPIAFGLVALLVIWYAIVKPILAQNKTDYEAVQTAANTNLEAANVNRIAAQINNETARTLQQSIANLLEAKRD